MKKISLGVYDCKPAKNILFDDEGASLFPSSEKQRKKHLKLLVPYIGKKIRVYLEVIK